MIHLNRFHRAIPLVDPDLVSAFTELPVAAIYESMNKNGLLHAAIRPIWAGARACGPASTAYVRLGDNLSVHAAMEVAPAGSIMVVAGETTDTYAMWGGLFTLQAGHRQLAGVVADGGVRDLDLISDRRFPVWARHVNARGATKEHFGAVNVPVVCGGVVVAPGDIIVADGDGVVAVPRTRAEDVLVATRAKLTAEDNISAGFAAGRTYYNSNNLNDRLRSGGATITDEPYTT